MVRQAKLSASPQSAAIARIVRSGAPSWALEMTIGLRVPASIAPNWLTSSMSEVTSSGRPIDMTKSILGNFSHNAAMPSTSARRARRRLPVSASRV
jgi:hypothetical protein